MSEELLLYDLTDSPFCAKARICLQLKGVSYRRVTLTIRRLREVRRLNPLGQVPVLLCGSDVVSDSSTIVRFLEARHPEPALLPRDPAAAAYCSLVEEWADEGLSIPIAGFRWLNPENRSTAVATTARELGGGAFPGAFAAILAGRVRRRLRAQGYTCAALPRLEDRMRENLATLEQLLVDRDYLLGRRRTVADVSAFAQLALLRGCAEARLLAAAPRVVAWMDRMESVPAIATALVA